MYRRPQASSAPQEGWAGQKKDLGVCPGSNSRHPLTRDPWLCPAPAPIRSPKHPDTNTTPPKQLEAVSGCGPPISCLCLLYPGLRRGWQGRERGTCGWHGTLVALLSDFHPRGHSPFPYSRIPNSSSSPPTPQAEALLHPGGEDSLIKVFRNAGGWRLRRGGVI